MDSESKKRFDEIVQKDPGSLTDEEVGFLAARRSYLNGDQLVKFSQVLPADISSTDESKSKSKSKSK